MRHILLFSETLQNPAPKSDSSPLRRCPECCLQGGRARRPPGTAWVPMGGGGVGQACDTPCFSRFQVGTLFTASAKGRSQEKPGEWSECFSAGPGSGSASLCLLEWQRPQEGGYLAAGLGLCRRRGPLAALCPLVGGAVRGSHGSDRGPQEEVRRQVQRWEHQSYSWDLRMGTFPEPLAGMWLCRDLGFRRVRP